MNEKVNLGQRPEKEATHESMADDMANNIINSFCPEKQNEIVRRIRQIISEKRQLRIDEVKKELDYLQSTLEQL